MKKSTKIRSFKNNDIEKILEIYNYHIENGYSNFEEKKVSKKYFNNLCKKIINNKLPFLIYEKNNIVVGFTYLTNFRNKSGYKFSFENSIYIHNDFKGKGIGQKLLKKLILESKKNHNIKTIIAVIASYNSNASVEIHKKNGFKIIGTLKKIGFKKNKWLDSIFMQKTINEKN